MITFGILIVFALVQLFIGFGIGYVRGLRTGHSFSEKQEKEAYRIGFQDGFFHIKEYSPEVFKEVDEKSLEKYVEFKSTQKYNDAKGFPHTRNN